MAPVNKLRRHWQRGALVGIAIIGAIVPVAAFADIAPKPSIQFRISAPKNVSILTGILLQCESADCPKERPLPALGPQRFDCEGTVCSGQAYGFTKFGALRIRLSDGKNLRSNVFRIGSFDSKFDARIGGSDLVVTPRR